MSAVHGDYGRNLKNSDQFLSPSLAVPWPFISSSSLKTVSSRTGHGVSIHSHFVCHRLAFVWLSSNLIGSLSSFFYCFTGIFQLFTAWLSLRCMWKWGNYIDRMRYGCTQTLEWFKELSIVWGALSWQNTKLYYACAVARIVLKFLMDYVRWKCSVARIFNEWSTFF